MKREQIREFIKDLKEEIVFFLFEEKELEEIIPFFELRHFPANNVVFREGEVGDFICFILSGKLEVKKETEFKGNQIILAILGKGSLVGELSLFDKYYRSATVEAVEDSLLLMLKNSALDALIEQYPKAGIKLLKGFIRVLSLRLRKVTERLTTIF
ncbi:MAG: cyclic nucleotide-binding domain-containing protein [Nitrospirota bacterium]